VALRPLFAFCKKQKTIFGSPVQGIKAGERTHGIIQPLSQHPSRGYERKAADILRGLNNASSSNVPDRICFEIVNSQARAAVLLNDIDAFEMHLHEGLDGAMLLGSRQRMRELQQAWRDARAKWPNDRRVKALTERLQLTPSNDDRETLA
jgi:hypothetical protein